MIKKNLPKLDFNVTNRCNFRCIHCCFRSGERLLEEFSLEKIKEVLNDFISLGGKRIDITGGEPLLRNDIKEEIVDPFAWLELAREKFIPRQNKIKLSLETPILETKNTKKVNISCYLENPWHLQLLPDGNVYPCAIMAFYNRPCGNLYEKSLKDIWYDKKLWNGEYYQQNVMPLINKYKSCINFGKKFKDIIKKKNYKFVCLMCKCDCKQLKK